MPQALAKLGTISRIPPSGLQGFRSERASVIIRRQADPSPSYNARRGNPTRLARVASAAGEDWHIAIVVIAVLFWRYLVAD